MKQPIVRSIEQREQPFRVHHATLVGVCEGCGRRGEVEEYENEHAPFDDERRVFCDTCTGAHSEARCFW